MRMRYGGAAVLLVLGIGLVANPYYLWPHHGDETYELRVGEPVGDAGDPVALDELPPETARTIEAAIDAYEGPDDPPIYADRGAIPLEGLSFDSGRPIVTADGTAYVVTIDRVDRSPPALPESPFVRATLGFGAALALTLGSTSAVTGRFRLTTRHAWAVVPFSLLVLAATVVYDGGIGGVTFAGPNTRLFGRAAVGQDVERILGVVPWILPAIGLVIGVAIRRGRWRDAADRLGEVLCVAAFVVVTWLVTVPAAMLGMLIADPDR